VFLLDRVIKEDIAVTWRIHTLTEYSRTYLNFCNHFITPQHAYREWKSYNGLISQIDLIYILVYHFCASLIFIRPYKNNLTRTIETRKKGYLALNYLSLQNKV